MESSSSWRSSDLREHGRTGAGAGQRRPGAGGLFRAAGGRGFHGVHGGLRVEVLPDDPAARYAIGRILHVEGDAAPLTIVEARAGDPGWVLRFREVPSRNAAEFLRDRYLEAAAADVPRPPRGKYFWHEFVGVAVSDPDGAPLGVVKDIYRSGGAEMLVVEDGPRGAFDLPIARPYIRDLAPRQGRIVADPESLDLPGLDEIKPQALPRPPRPRRATRRRPAVPMPPARPRDDAETAEPNEASEAESSVASSESFSGGAALASGESPAE